MKCSKCKAPVAQDDMFCGQCGLKRPSPSEVSETGFLLGTLSDMKACFSALLKNQFHWSSLTAEISGTDDFFQFFTDDGKIICLNFPVRTERQNALHDKAVEILNARLGLDPWYEEFENGDMDLVCSFPANVSTSSMQASQFVCMVFGVNENTEIRFQLL